jgi:hypothetical protein
MISAIEVDADGQLTRIRLWDKISALEKGMKHLGMFEKGRVPAHEKLAIQVVFVDPPRPPDPMELQMERHAGNGRSAQLIPRLR